jgi:hypothetical protein
LMLTTTGHGLYLSSTMSPQERHSATVALMLSLLLSGAIGTWITCGGGYYLASMAFSAMNLFVVTRLLGGFAFTLIVGFVGFVAFTCTTGVRAAVVFFLYLIALTTYLCLLAALANFQFSGSAFQSVCTRYLHPSIPVLTCSLIGSSCHYNVHTGSLHLTSNDNLPATSRHRCLSTSSLYLHYIADFGSPTHWITLDHLPWMIL